MVEAKAKKANLVQLLIKQGWNPPRVNTDQMTWILQDIEDVHPGAKLDVHPRGVQLLSLAAEGNTLTESAKALGLSYETTKKYWTRIRDALGAKDQAHAVAIALREGIIE